MDQIHCGRASSLITSASQHVAVPLTARPASLQRRPRGVVPAPGEISAPLGRDQGPVRGRRRSRLPFPRCSARTPAVLTPAGGAQRRSAGRRAGSGPKARRAAGEASPRPAAVPRVIAPCKCDGRSERCTFPASAPGSGTGRSTTGASAAWRRTQPPRPHLPAPGRSQGAASDRTKLAVCPCCRFIRTGTTPLTAVTRRISRDRYRWITVIEVGFQGMLQNASADSRTLHMQGRHRSQPLHVVAPRADRAILQQPL